MAQNVSPGVYTKIIDLSEYVRSVPSTIGYIPVITEKGPDNELIFTNSRDYYVDFGEPNISYASKIFGQGPYVASSFLRESDALYTVRVLPDDADYANLILNAEASGGFGVDGTSTVIATSNVGVNTLNEIDTILEGTNPCIVFRGVGRGEYYNEYQINLAQHSNPQLGDPTIVGTDVVYVLDIYQRQAEDDEEGAPQYEIITSYNVSFNPSKLDSSSESMFIGDVVNRYNRFLKVVADEDKCAAAVINGADFSQPFTTPVNLAEGSSGSLFDVNGAIDSTVATQLLSKAYNGTLSKPKLDTQGNPMYVYEILDTDNVYITIVMDGGYPTDVKTSGIQSLVQARKDCVALVDNGDNVSSALALSARQNTHTFNTRYMALYESYSKVFDSYTGKDLWLTPIYHMANIVPYTDNVSELWYAPAGFNRATIASIKELRYSPLISERDQFYLNQINPIVKFNVGYTVYGQLTTQKRPTALQDLNIVRLVLYIKRALEQFCKFYVFEQNDSTTWSAISQQISRFLRVIQNKRGLYSFSVDVGATDYELKAKQIHANVTLDPTRVVEQIHLNFFIK
ncbi:MAG: hypothetical protein KAS32_17785 [Candidatus Peribacteraceae bacterium]|nr:hypothetical protein [Candidatus Peribacteraceae bacterium]